MVSQRSLFLLAAVLMMAALLLALPAFVVDSRSGTTHVQLEPDAFCDTVTEIPTIECDALVALYDSTDGPNWTDNTGWLETYTPCSWYGVTCSASHVSWLSLYDNQLSGSIPPELADLDNLQILWLHDNQLTGGIPIELGGLVNLQELYLHRNQLSGNIPPDLGGLTNLRTLRIGWNQLDGAIPPELGGLGNLEELFLTHNQLSGNIPPELGGLTNLRHLHLDSNQLNGSIPSELAGLANLVYLYLSYNQLSGEIPPWLGGLTNLEHLVLYENQLSGSIPLQLGGLANLTELHLSYNQLSGSIPPELGDLTNLKVLVLSSNQLSGEIPSELGGLANLAYLYLSNNQLSGSIPPELGSLTGLQGLSLQGNGLGAAIPAAIIDLVNLDPARTDLGYNMLTSSEPAVVAFLNEKDSDWADTQTVSPTGLKITWISDTSVEVSWEPIIYTGDGGYYEVSYATIAGGPYTVHGTTPDKTAAGYMAGGLSTGMTYYLVVRTHTPAHGDQQNELWSGFSQEVSATLAAEACQARINDHPTEYDDVQSAVDAAADGDVVKVAGYCSGVEHRPGVTQTVYMSKDITLRGGYSASDWTTPHPESNPTTLDALGLGRVVYITGDISATMEGLCITGGDATGLSGDPWGNDVGGGVLVGGGSGNPTVTIADSHLYGNTAERGAGLHSLSGSTCSLSRNLIHANSASDLGGGIGTYLAHLILQDNAISSNVAEGGAGLSLGYSTAELRGNTITSNSAIGEGGGMRIWGSRATLVANVIAGNSATEGGGLDIKYWSSVDLANNIVADNQASAVGSGLNIRRSAALLQHTTIADNSSGDGVGVYINDSYGTPSTVALTNTILAGHPVAVFVGSGNVATLEATLWHDNAEDTAGAGTALTGTLNVYGDPVFVDAVSGDFHVRPASAAIDVGMTTSVMDDIDREARPFGAGPDLGADEWASAETVAEPSSGSSINAIVRGLPTTVAIPPGAVTQTTTLRFTALATATHGVPAVFAFADHAFDLAAYRNGAPLSGLVLNEPATVTITYADAEVVGIGETELVLGYWNGSAWADAACGPYDRHPAENWVALPVCHLSQFALYGTKLHSVHLPLVLRSAP